MLFVPFCIINVSSKAHLGRPRAEEPWSVLQKRFAEMQPYGGRRQKKKKPLGRASSRNDHVESDGTGEDHHAPSLLLFGWRRCGHFVPAPKCRITRCKDCVRINTNLSRIG